MFKEEPTRFVETSEAVTLINEDEDKYVKAAVEVMKEWVSDPTEEAPDRWTHTGTGEYRYQESEPQTEPSGDSDDGGGNVLDGIMDDFEDMVGDDGEEEEDDTDDGDDEEPLTDEEIEDIFREDMENLPVVPDPPSDDDPAEGVSPEPSAFEGGERYSSPEDLQSAAEGLSDGELLGINVEMRDLEDEDDYGPFAPETTIPFYDGENSKYAHTDIVMDTDDFSNLQAQIHQDYADSSRARHFGSAREDDVRDYAEAMEEGEEFPMPHIVVNEEGKVVNEQEGRHRSLAAMAAGYDEVPVRVVVEPGRDAKTYKIAREIMHKAGGLFKHFRKEWVSDPTEQAPNRWTHTETGEHRYQDTKPGEVDGGGDEGDDTPDVSEFGITDTWNGNKGVLRSIEALEAGVSREEVLEEFKSRWSRAGEELGEFMLENSTDESPLLSQMDSRIDEAEEEFKEENPEVYEQATEAISTWQTSMFDETSAPIWQYAAEVTGNENVGAPEEYEGVPLGTEVEGEQIEAVKSLHDHTVETLKDEYGDEIVVFRGVSSEGNTSSRAEGSDLAEDLVGASESGENVRVQHRSLESWSMDPSYAGKYAQDEESGAVIADTISPEDVLVSSLSGAGKIAPHENEMVVMNDEKEYKPEQVISDDEVEDELFDMYFYAAAELIQE
jgi:hypothetical protein